MYSHDNTGWICRRDQQGYPVERIDPEERPRTATGSKPETCYFWFTSEKGCSKSAEECKFAHTNTGLLKGKQGPGSERIDPNLLPAFMRNQRRPSVPTATAANAVAVKSRMGSGELTCFFWNEGKCKNTPEKCPYQHRYTGVVADPPKSFLRRGEYAGRSFRQGANQRKQLPREARFKLRARLSGLAKRSLRVTNVFYNPTLTTTTRFPTCKTLTILFPYRRILNLLQGKLHA
jgi:hypothetical protein